MSEVVESESFALFGDFFSACWVSEVARHHQHSKGKKTSRGGS